MISFFYIHQTIKNSVGKTVSFHTVTSKSIGLMKVDLKFTSIRNDCTTAKDIVTWKMESVTIKRILLLKQTENNWAAAIRILTGGFIKYSPGRSRHMISRVQLTETKNTQDCFFLFVVYSFWEWPLVIMEKYSSSKQHFQLVTHQWKCEAGQPIKTFLQKHVLLLLTLGSHPHLVVFPVRKA